jgi:hypothetical protein
MNRFASGAGAAALAFAASLARDAGAQPETLTCQLAARGNDCSAGRCSVSNVTAGGKFRFDLAAKTMCAVQDDKCVPVGGFGSFHRDADSGAVMIFIGDARGAMNVRIAKPGDMVVATVTASNSVAVFGGKCEK